eukprot:4401328-Prymnesium_polylepis.1
MIVDTVARDRLADSGRGPAPAGVASQAARSPSPASSPPEHCVHARTGHGFLGWGALPRIVGGGVAATATREPRYATVKCKTLEVRASLD